MRVIIYGIGKYFLKLFGNCDFIDEFIENQFEIIGFADKSNIVKGRKISYCGKTFIVKGIQEFLNNDFDYIIVMSKIHYNDIRNELIDNGYEKKQIISVDFLSNIYFDKIYNIENFDKKIGLEIGGPTKNFENIYNKCARCDGVNFSIKTVWWKNETNDYRYNNVILGKIFLQEATDMWQIKDESYEFVLSSNNLEHIANPLKALMEFSRVTKNGGTILVIVPRKSETFDHNRDYTTFDHLLEDYNKDIGEDDLTHLSEIIEKHDYDMDTECGGIEKFIERSKKNIENRCLHHHVFSEECLRKSFQFSGIEVIKIVKLPGSDLAILGKKLNRF